MFISVKPMTIPATKLQVLFSYLYCMIRSVITPETNHLDIAIPDNYVGKKVEVLVFTCEEANEIEDTAPDVMAQFWGGVSDKTTEEMHHHINHSRSEW